MQYADVIVPLGVEGTFTYLVPDALAGNVTAGTLVLVPFVGNKKYTAIVLRVHGECPMEYSVKPIEGIADEQVRLSPVHLQFLLWLSKYYMASPGEVMRAALPVVFRLESYTAITRTEKDVDYSILSENERIVLGFLTPGEYVSLKEVERCLRIKNGMPVVKSLLAKHYVRVKEKVDEAFREKKVAMITWERAFSDEELGRCLDGLKRAPAQHKMLCIWIEQGLKEAERSGFLAKNGLSAAALKGLCERGILRVEEQVVSRLSSQGEQGELTVLSSEQVDALNRIRHFYLGKDCVLLKGVTSSGKTEVYIHLIKEYLQAGKQVLYMLPEIALTYQIVKRLRNVFGEQVGLYHSGMPEQMRAELWRKQCGTSPFGLILGVRSSVFLPFAQLGLVIVDEEHDASYKQKEPAPRYQGRDAAIMLAKMSGAKVLLGSATPSFESYQHAVAGKYGLVELKHRYGGALMPEMVLADLKEYRRKKMMKGSFSPLLVREMERVLQEHKQVILFQNRRGYSSYVQCEQCGSIPKCPHCDVSLTYYKQRNVLACRYCGVVVSMPFSCPECGTGHYQVRTPGTERVEEEVKHLFPECAVARIDLDVAGSKARFARVMDDFEQQKIDVLIGTQMVSKGLDFEHVKLVGVIDADGMVNFPDFRAEERAYCMLSQVGGRSGRKGGRGKIVIQTANLNNRLYGMLLEGNYHDFFTCLSEERQWFVYPPFGRLIQVELRHKDVAVLRNAANGLAGRLRQKLGKRVCGPAVPEVGKINEAYRLVLLLKIEPATSCSAVKALLKDEFVLLRQNKMNGTLRIICDVDP